MQLTYVHSFCLRFMIIFFIINKKCSAFPNNYGQNRDLVHSDNLERTVEYDGNYNVISGDNYKLMNCECVPYFDPIMGESNSTVPTEATVSSSTQTSVSASKESKSTTHATTAGTTQIINSDSMETESVTDATTLGTTRTIIDDSTPWSTIDTSTETGLSSETTPSLTTISDSITQIPVFVEAPAGPVPSISSLGNPNTTKSIV